MRDLAERAYFGACTALGRWLRAARYARVVLVREGGELRVHKRRALYAPLLVGLGLPLMRLLGSGVRVLPRLEWEARERQLHGVLYGASVTSAPRGTLVLPHLPGRTLASLLEDPASSGADRREAMRRAAEALAALHHSGLTHGDAMAENVLVDPPRGAARWFDFETLHDPARPPVWRRADDVRALLATCLLRTPAEELPATTRLILDAYADDAVLPPLAESFGSALRRPLPFHLGQAPLPLPRYREIGRLLRERLHG